MSEMPPLREQGLVCWESSYGEFTFVFKNAQDAENQMPCNVEVTISATKYQQLETVVLHNDGTIAVLDLYFGPATTLAGKIYLRPLHANTTNRCVWGEFGYSDSRHQILYFDGCMVLLPPCGEAPPCPAPQPPPCPIPHPCPVPAPSPGQPSQVPIIASGLNSDDELFPYVYMRHWPQMESREREFSFIQYSATTESPPPDGFIEQLESLKSAAAGDARDTMEVSSQSYIEGLPPFQGCYLGDIFDLGSPMEYMPALVDVVQREPGITVEQLGVALPSLLGMEWPELNCYLSSSDFLLALQRVWGSYMALTITLGNDHANLVQLTRLLCGVHLLQQCIGPDGKLRNLLPEQLQQLARAPVLLPATIFPLPPSIQSASPPASSVQGWLGPYAIGDLQMLRQRFIRYQPGEIAHIENVMAGEQREVAYTKAKRQLAVHQDHGLEENVSTALASEQEDKLLDELRRTVTEKTSSDDYHKLTTSYGPPTQAIVDGTVTHAISAGPNPGTRDRTRLARQVLEQSLSRIHRRVESLRSNSTLDESESVRRSVFDNRDNSREYVGIYRWLNRIYQAYVVNYGNRLMLEFMVPRPAARFLKEEQAQHGLDLIKPLSLEQQGVVTATDVSAENSVTLAAYYRVKGITPPPPPLKVVSSSLRSGEQARVVLPEGYRVIAVKVMCMPAIADTAAVQVLVGGQMLPADSELQGVQLFGEEGSLSIIAPSLPDSASPPADNDFAVSVRVSCGPTPESISLWQMATYNALAEGCRCRTERFFREAGARRSMVHQSPQSTRVIERRSLKRDCIALLLARHTELTGERSCPPGQPAIPPSQFEINGHRYLQFFEEMLEWGEMSYNFYSGAEVNTGETSDYLNISSPDNSVFSAFLEAEMARILIPVRPGHERALLYYLSSGMVWFGLDRYVAVNPADAALVHEIIQVDALCQHPDKLVGEAWEVVVPTTMQVLDSCGIASLWQHQEEPN